MFHDKLRRICKIIINLVKYKSNNIVFENEQKYKTLNMTTDLALNFFTQNISFLKEVENGGALKK